MIIFEMFLNLNFELRFLIFYFSNLRKTMRSSGEMHKAQYLFMWGWRCRFRLWQRSKQRWDIYRSPVF